MPNIVVYKLLHLQQDETISKAMKLNFKQHFTIISLCFLTFSLNATINPFNSITTSKDNKSNKIAAYSHSCPTDINKDGITNDKDVELLLKKFGQSCTCCPEDVNRDGVINVQDLSEVLLNNGVSCGCGGKGDQQPSGSTTF